MNLNNLDQIAYYTKMPFYSRMKKHKYKGDLYILFNSKNEIIKTFIQLDINFETWLRPIDSAMLCASGYSSRKNIIIDNQKYEARKLFGSDFSNYGFKNRKPIAAPNIKIKKENLILINKYLLQNNIKIKTAIGFLSGSNPSGAESKPLAIEVYAKLENIFKDCIEKVNIFSVVEAINKWKKITFNSLDKLKGISYKEPIEVFKDLEFLYSFFTYNFHLLDYQQIYTNANIEINNFILNLHNSAVYKKRESKIEKLIKAYEKNIFSDLIDMTQDNFSLALSVTKAIKRSRGIFRSQLINYTKNLIKIKNINTYDYTNNQTNLDLLEAAHIYNVEWVKRDINQNIKILMSNAEIKKKKQAKENIKKLISYISDPNNGILIDSSVHKLFDKFYITFDSYSGKAVQMKSTNSKELNNLNKLYLHFPQGKNPDRSNFLEMRNKKLNKYS